MASLLSTLNAVLLAATTAQQKRDAILFFVCNFLKIHPFGDANARVIYMVSDLLLIMEDLPPMRFGIIRDKDRNGLERAIEKSRMNHDVAPLYAVIEHINPAALA